MGAAAALVVGLITSVGLPSTPAFADTTTPLAGSPLSLVVDSAHSHIFVVDSGTIEVTDLSGNVVATVPDTYPITNVSSMLLQPDDSTLYVADSADDSIVAIDTTRLTETGRYSLDQQGSTATHSPRSLAAADGEIWFGYTGRTDSTYNAAFLSGIGALDLSGASPAVTYPGPVGQAPYAPQIAAGPGAPGVIAASIENADNATGVLAVYSASNGVLTQTTSTVTDYFGSPIRITPDGQEVVTTRGEYQTGDLTQTRTFAAIPDDKQIIDLSVGPDGAVALVDGAHNGSDGPRGLGITVYGPGGTKALRTYALGYTGTGETPLGLTDWGTDGKLYGIQGAWNFLGTTALDVFDNPEQAESSLTATAATSVVPGQQFAVTGTLSSPAAIPVGTVLRVTRTDAADPNGTVLPNVTVAAAGSYSFTDTQTTEGTYTYTYTVAYAGDAAHQPATSPTVTVKVAKHSSTIRLSAPATATRAKPFTITGGLTNAPYAAGAVVRITKTDLDHPQGISLGSAKVASNGSFSFTDTPADGGTNTYHATFAGDVAHTAATTVEANVAVSRIATALSLTTNSTTYNENATATITADLGTTFTDRKVSIYAQVAGGSKTLIASGTVNSHGTLTTRHKVTRQTTFTAVYAGDQRYAPAAAARPVYVYAHTSEALTGYYGSATINGTTFKTYHHTAKPAVTATVSPNKTGQCVVFELQRYYSNAWHNTAVSSCHTLTSGSNATDHLVGLTTGGHYRIEAQYHRSKTDSSNLNSTSTWQYFTVRS